MKKNVYSLVLSDDVINAIDDLAYKMNTSRSNYINQILAEHVSYKTPESLMKDVFNCMKAIMDGHFQVQGQASDAMLLIRSPLRYKYKPTIRYRVELLKSAEGERLGNLSVSFRTQSTQLLTLFEGFFKLWSNIEKAYMNQFFQNGVELSYSDGRFIRILKVSDRIKTDDPDILGNVIGNYIRMLDSEIKLYFAEIENIESASLKMENLLLNTIKYGNVII